MAIEINVSALMQRVRNSADAAVDDLFAADEVDHHPGMAASTSEAMSGASVQDFPDWVASDDDTDDLAASRGITTAALVGSAIWACAGLVVWLM